MKSLKTDTEKLRGLRAAIRQVISYPPKGHPRRAKNGFPTEFIYDRWAYERMISSIRDGLETILTEFK